MATLIAMFHGHDGSVLQFNRAPDGVPHLTVIEGGAARSSSRASGTDPARGALRPSPVLLVLAATLVAVLVDLVDSVPVWSHWAALGTAFVLTAHTAARRLRTR